MGNVILLIYIQTIYIVYQIATILHENIISMILETKWLKIGPIRSLRIKKFLRQPQDMEVELDLETFFLILYCPYRE